MRATIIVVSFVAALLAGCASPQTVKEVKEAQGHGVSRVYASAPGAVHNAVLAAAKAKDLQVVEDDEAAGRIVLSHGVTPLSWGEKIAVFLTPVPPDSTKVEIVSKPVMSTLNFPPDWPKILHDQIAAELKGKQ